MNDFLLVLLTCTGVLTGVQDLADRSKCQAEVSAPASSYVVCLSSATALAPALLSPLIGGDHSLRLLGCVRRDVTRALR